MSQKTSGIRSLQGLSRRYAERVGDEARRGFQSMQQRVDDFTASRRLGDKLESLKAELADVNSRSQKLLSELLKLSEKISGDIKNRISGS